MELVVRKNDLLRELQLFQGIVERKNTIPILANVLIEANGRRGAGCSRRISKSGCAAGATRRSRSAGSLTLPAKKLYEIVKALPETDIRIEEDKNGVKVAADRFDSRMQTLPREDFPTLPEATGAVSATLPRDVLKEMVGEDAVRDHRRGHALFPERRAVRAARRLDEPGRDRRPSPGAGHVPRDGRRRRQPTRKSGSILPKKTLCELGRLLAEGEGDIRYERGENHLFFDVGGRLLISRMIDGQFPAYERVIPKGNDKHIEFERDRLTNAVQARGAAVERTFARGEVPDRQGQGRRHVEQPGIRRSEGDVLTVDYTGAPMQICFNAQYVLDFLGVVDDRCRRARIEGRMSQAVMKPVGAEGYDYTYVIMPMRV